MKALKLTLILSLFPLVSFAGGSDGGPGVLQPILMANAISIEIFEAPMAFNGKASSYDSYLNDNGWVEFEDYLVKFVSINESEIVRFLVDDGEIVRKLKLHEEIVDEYEGLGRSLEESQKTNF